MSVTWIGNLTKNEIVALLGNSGSKIKDVYELNQIMKDMGLLIYSEGHWLITEEALKYTSGNIQVFDEDIWLPTVVDAIREFLNK